MHNMCDKSFAGAVWTVLFTLFENDMANDLICDLYLSIFQVADHVFSSPQKPVVDLCNSIGQKVDEAQVSDHSVYFHAEMCDAR